MFPSSGSLGTPLGALLGPLGGLLGAWSAVGRLSWAAWERLGPFVCVLGNSWGRFGPSWAVSGAPREARGRGTGSVPQISRRCGTPGPGGGVFVYIIYDDIFICACECVNIAQHITHIIWVGLVPPEPPAGAAWNHLGGTLKPPWAVWAPSGRARGRAALVGGRRSWGREGRLCGERAPVSEAPRAPGCALQPTRVTRWRHFFFYLPPAGSCMHSAEHAPNATLGAPRGGGIG